MSSYSILCLFFNVSSYTVVICSLIPPPCFINLGVLISILSVVVNHKLSGFVELELM